MSHRYLTFSQRNYLVDLTEKMKEGLNSIRQERSLKVEAAPSSSSSGAAPGKQAVCLLILIFQKLIISGSEKKISKTIPPPQ
jgi:hypothetical protein